MIKIVIWLLLFLMFFTIITGSAQLELQASGGKQWSLEMNSNEKYPDSNWITYCLDLTHNSTLHDISDITAISGLDEGIFEFSWKTNVVGRYAKINLSINGINQTPPCQSKEFEKLSYPITKKVPLNLVTWFGNLKGGKVWMAFPLKINAAIPKINVNTSQMNVITPKTNVTPRINVTISNATLISRTGSQACVIVSDKPEIQEGLPILTNISEAIEYAYTNRIDKIFIKNGNYSINKSIYLYKPIIIEGETKNKVNLSSVQANNTAIRIISNNCTIENISLSGFSLCVDSTYSDNVTINNNILDSIRGIYIIGGSGLTIQNNDLKIKNTAILLKSCQNVVISNNNFSGTKGFYISHCKDIIIKENNLVDLDNLGLCIDKSDLIKLFYNNLRSNNNQWIKIDKSETIQLDCNWWNDFAGSNQCQEIIHMCDKACPIAANDGIVYDNHPYCTINGWKFEKE